MAASGRTRNRDGTFGNRTFNTASVVEAADTAPFFHNNVVSTLEDVVEFYTGPNSTIHERPLHSFNFDVTTQIEQIADFMRGVNTLQNIDVARRELQEILANNGNPQANRTHACRRRSRRHRTRLTCSTEGGIFPAAVPHLTAARS